MKLPKTVKLGTQIWEITEQKRKHNSDFHEGTYAYTIDKNNTIVLDIDMSESVKRVTLFHELLHAIRFIFGGQFQPPRGTTYLEWEHYWIGLYEEPVVMMLRDNPDLVAYLVGDELA